eukprot:83427_1
MALYYSTIVSIIYFVVNIIFMFGLAFYVYKSGNHKLKSKSYLKDVWSQRKIFWPLIIHFYDTATDIGVIYNWHVLMKVEEDPKVNFESVDMKTFFWCGITFLIIFRTIQLIISIGEFIDGDRYRVFLVLVDLYIFAVVYESFTEAHGIITKNAERRQKNAEKKKQRRRENIDKQLQVAVEMGQITTDKALDIQVALEDEIEIEPHEDQMIVQFVEAVTESMPQIVLQSVFIIRSANDEVLSRGGSNIELLLFSALASLFSISNKFVWFDKHSVFEIAKSLKPRQTCPHCIHYWYIVRAIWRLCNILSTFVVFTLIWVVMGGAWLPIWVGAVFIFWAMCAARMERLAAHRDKYERGDVLTGLAGGVLFIVAIADASKPKIHHFVYKSIETTVALSVITVFATTKFKCGICADPGTRMLFGTNNNRVFIYWMTGIVAHVMNVLLYTCLHCANILMDEVEVMCHDRWGHSFGSDEDGEQFKKFITDYEKERITGIRMCGELDMQFIQFQINGIWRGRIGKQEDSEYQELLLDEDEYVNKVMLNYSILRRVQFWTNKDNTIKAGSGNDEIKTLQGNFILVDCKGRCDAEKVHALVFLWHKVIE